MTEDEITAFRRWRLSLGLSQIAAARKLGYGITQIAEYDRGERHPPLVVLFAMSAVKANMQPFTLEDAA